MGLNNALLNRPVRVLGFVAAIHAIINGIGYFTGAGGFSQTELSDVIDSRQISEIFGISLVLTGAVLAFAYARNNPKTIKLVSSLCGTVWLFATLVYLISGAWLLALGVSFPWMVIAYYLAFAYKNRQAIIAYDQTPQAIEDTINESQP